MLKGDAVTNTITIVGIAVIGALMFTKVPGVIDDIKIVLSKTSVIGKAAEIADLLTLSMTSPGDIKITYSLPEEVTYKVSVKDGYVNVSTDTEWAVSKTLSNFCFKFEPCDPGYTYLENKKVCDCDNEGEELCPRGDLYPHEKCRQEIVKFLMITKNKIEKVE